MINVVEADGAVHAVSLFDLGGTELTLNGIQVCQIDGGNCYDAGNVFWDHPGGAGNVYQLMPDGSVRRYAAQSTTGGPVTGAQTGAAFAGFFQQLFGGLGQDVQIGTAHYNVGSVLLVVAGIAFVASRFQVARRR